MFKLILINSVLKVLLYGKIRAKKNPMLEILEIEVCNILQNPGNIGKRSFSTSSYPGNIGKRIFQLPHILEILENGFFQLPHILEIVDLMIHTQSYPGNSGSYDPYISPISCCR